MQTKIQQLFKSVAPYSIVTDLGRSIEQRNNRFLTTVPASDTPLVFTDREFITTNPRHGEFCYGSIFDFMAACFDGDYGRVVDHMFDRYSGMVDKQILSDIKFLRSGMVSELEYQRKEFESILKLRDNILFNAQGLGQALMEIRGKRVNPTNVFLSVYAARGNELSDLLHLTGVEQDKFLIDPKAAYIINPYFVNFHTFAALHIHCTRDGSRQFIPLHPASHSYFGLHSVNPLSDDVRVYGHIDEALERQSAMVDDGNFDVGHVTLRFQHSAPFNDKVVTKATFMVKNPDVDLGVLTQHRLCFDDFSVVESNTAPLGIAAPPSIPWTQYLLHTVSRLSNESHGAFTPKLGRVFDHIRADETAMDVIRQWLKAHKGCHAILEHVHKYSQASNSWTLDTVVVDEKRDGYVARKINSPVEARFTNFVIRIKHSVTFEHTSETFYCGNIFIEDQSIPIWIPESCMDNGKKIEGIARTAAKKHCTQGEAPLPMLYDTSFAKRLATVLKMQVGRAHQSGIDRFGWTESKSHFITPRWKASAQGISDTSMLVHPNGHLDQYEFADPHYDNDFSGVNSQHRAFLAALVGMITRSFFNLPTPVVHVHRCKPAIDLLSSIFVPLGQRQAFPINPNDRGNGPVMVEDIYTGYPLFATCINERILEDYEYPMFLLSDSGLHFSDTITPVQYAAIYSYAYSIISRVTCGLLQRGRLVAEIVDMELPAIPDLIYEGKKVIELLLQEEFSIFESDMPHLHRVLCSIKHEELSRFFRFDLAAQCVYIYCRKIEMCRRKDIFEELLLKDASAFMHQEHYIGCDQEVITGLLSKFYGKPVQLSAMPSTPDRTVTDSARTTTLRLG